MSVFVLVSIAVRAASTVWAARLLHRHRDSRFLFLAVIAAAAVFRQMYFTPDGQWSDLSPGAPWFGLSLKTPPVEVLGCLFSGLILAAVWLTRDTMEESRRTSMRFATLLRLTGDGYCVLDAHGRIREASASLARALAFSPGELVSRPLLDYVHPDDREATRRAIDSTRTAEECQSMSNRLRAGIGTVRWFDWSFCPEAPDCTLAVARDVTGTRRLERDVLRISEREKTRIGRDLHDGLGQILTAVRLRLNRGRDGGDPSRDWAGEVESHLDEALEQTRALARNLNPIDVALGGLRYALERMCATFGQVHGLEVRLEWMADELNPEARDATLEVFRIAQEATSNAIRHGHAERIVVAVTMEEDDMVLVVDDNGVGIDDEFQPDGLGLRVMRYRSEMVGGSLTIEGGRPVGTIVRCRVPVRRLLTARNGELHVAGHGLTDRPPE